jgi:hypothetical protein
MASHTATVKNPEPPKWLFKHVINPTMKLILRSPLHGLLSKGLSLLTFTGRKSGRQFTTPVAYNQDKDGTVYVFTRSAWWENLRDGKPVTIRIKGQQYQATPAIIQDKAAVWELVSRFAQEAGGDYRRVGVMLGEDASEADIRAAASDLLAIKLTLH